MIKIEELKVKKIDEIEGLEIKTYVPITLKMKIAEKLSDKLIEEDSVGVCRCNPVDAMVAKKVALIALYTNIELLDNDYNNYDILSNGYLMQYFERYIGNDADDFYYVVDTTLKNRLEEMNSINHIFASKATDVVNIIDKTMDHINDMLDKGDPNKIAKYLSKGIEMIAAKIPDFSNVDAMAALKEFK